MIVYLSGGPLAGQSEDVGEKSTAASFPVPGGWARYVRPKHGSTWTFDRITQSTTALPVEAEPKAKPAWVAKAKAASERAARELLARVNAREQARRGGLA